MFGIPMASPTPVVLWCQVIDDEILEDPFPIEFQTLNDHKVHNLKVVIATEAKLSEAYYRLRVWKASIPFAPKAERIAQVQLAIGQPPLEPGEMLTDIFKGVEEN